MQPLYLSIAVILYPLYVESSCIVTCERGIVVNVFELDGDPVIFGGV